MLLAGVVRRASGRRRWSSRRDPGRQGQVGLVRREHDAVEAVDALALPLAGRRDPLDGRGERVEVVEADVPQRDVAGTGSSSMRSRVA